MRGRRVSSLLRDIDWDRLLELDGREWSRLINTELEISYPEHRFVNFYVVPLAGSETQERGAVIILRDVTRERENEATLLESERLNAVKLLAAGVAHEIGNPLNALNIHLQLLDREIKGLPISDCRLPNAKEQELNTRARELKELVEVARSEVARLDMIITQFLRAIRPTKPKVARCRVAALLEETLSLLKQEIQNRRIDVEIDRPSTLPAVRVDRDQIKQAFFNVIKNAFQAMPDGGSLKIGLSASNEFLRVEFRDTGMGISPDDMGRVFEPYHTTKGDGSGLGLMVVQRIVQEHGGQIELESKAGEGTHFTILLPLAERRMRLLKAHGK
jgi:signal transduction histidine kinase